MTGLALSQRDQENLLGSHGGYIPEDGVDAPVEPGFIGSGKELALAVPKGVGALVADVALPVADAYAEYINRPFYTTVDTVFGTDFTERAVRGPKTYARDFVRWTAPDPKTAGTLSHVIHGLVNVLPEVMLGGPEVAAALQGNKAMVMAQEQGLDDGTAVGMGLLTAAATWAGAKIPTKLAAGAWNIPATAGANVAFGIANRTATSALLNAAGYQDMAAQYEPLDTTGLMVDAVLGTAFGAWAHHSAMKEWRQQNESRLSPEDIATAHTLLQALHQEVGVAPGIPADPATRAAHVDYLNRTIEALLNGEDPPPPPEAIVNGEWVENPITTAAREDIGQQVRDHINPLGDLEGELGRRGLPTEPDLYSIMPDDRPPVRFTDRVRGMLDEWQKTGDTDGLLAKLNALKGDLEGRAAANEAKDTGDRVRGEAWLRERLARAERAGEISPKAHALVRWLLDKNPALANELALSIREGKAVPEGGRYSPWEKLVTLFTARANDLTAVHEILHHSERMLPDNIRTAIREKWISSLQSLRDMVRESGDPMKTAAVDDVIRAAAGDRAAFDRVSQLISSGQLGKEWYQYINPSEWWAVNAANLVRDRAGAEGWVGQARQFLVEMMEKVKDAFGLDSNAAIIRGLDAALKADGKLSGKMLATEVATYRDLTPGEPGAERPGQGVENENLNGFEPALRVRVDMTGTPMPAKPLILTGTNPKNAAKQIGALDGILAAFPDADTSPEAWSRMMAYAFASDDVPIPPYRFLKDINSDGAFNNLKRLTAGQIADADHGFENAKLFREAYTSGQLDVVTTGKLFMWSFLSRGVSPYTQESLFIDAFPGIDKWIQKAANGKLTEKDFPAYEKWAKSVAPKGAGQPGAGATHNLNAFGQLFLFKMGQKGADGVSLLQKMHNLLENPESTGPGIRRWFIENTDGVGIDNKVVSFTLLVAGFPDVMVLDRVQIRQLWDDGRFGDRNLYDGRKEDGAPVAGSALSNLTYGARGLLVYEAIERALGKRIQNLYSSLGRPQNGSIGRYHWESWVADSQQEASHGTLDAILADASGDKKALSRITAKEGEYGGYAYGARYGRDAKGNPYFLYRTPGGGEYQFTVAAFREFLDAVKSPKNKVVPSKFKVTEAGNAPWYEKPEVNKQALDQLAQRFGKPATARQPGKVEGAGAVRKDGTGQAVPDLAGSDARELVRLNPALTVPDEAGTPVPASQVLDQADAAIASAEADSPQFEAAAACFLRG